MAKFGTLEYFKQMADVVNNDAIIAKSKLSTTFLYVFDDQETEEGVAKAILLKFDSGKVTDVREARPDEDVEFVYKGKYEVLAGAAKGEIAIDAAIASGDIKVKYPLVKAMRNRRALEQIVSTWKVIPTEQ